MPEESNFWTNASARQWHEKIQSLSVDEISPKPSNADSCILTGNISGSVVIIVLRVDDLLLASSCIKSFEIVKKKLYSLFLLKT